MLSTRFDRIALISVDGDPSAEIGQEEAGGQNVYVQQVGETLARQGWQVDMFTRCTYPNQPKLVQRSATCCTIRSKDELAFAFAIDQILSNPDWRDQMGEAGRVMIEVGFSWDSVAARLGQLYNTFLSQPISPHKLAPVVA